MPTPNYSHTNHRGQPSSPRMTRIYELMDLADRRTPAQSTELSGLMDEQVRADKGLLGVRS